ncbi:energy-coupling factor transporter ATPase [Thermoflavimicrobium daqui]|uniref:Energy-coupling factor transporter ATP-binding protein EcfA2 n=1 Tax=Thermoflavimicrobium daqui TaxID=2137476 RepID=A0A364K3J2_9BACL|nr:energy-coupling factor transporter ATPase [Thermoflavimicrobium daqui]RAL23286.1 energy-coupling factor transporter ATPase [Thermoflavimicrobium daqui]
MEIVIKNLNHIYMPGTPFERQALQDLNMQISSGSFVAILGQTGSGKSTLIQLIAGLMSPTSGNIQIGSYHLTPNSKERLAVRKHVGVVFQYPEHQLFEETVVKDIAFGPRNQGLSEKEVTERVQMAMEMVGLSPELGDRSPFQLSGGQMRRVAIAGVLALSPEILILDEPTAGLDPHGKSELLNTISKLHKERQMTVILVTHDMNDAARFADYLFVLARGTCELEGTPGDVFKEQDHLVQFALDLPDITRLINQLNRQIHPPIPTNIFSMNELENHLIERLKKVVSL